VAASRYRIVLRGRLSERFESAFDGMTLEHGPNRTVLVGDVRDQAQLYGLLDRLQEFGIELLAVEPADISDGSSEPGMGLLPETGPAAGRTSRRRARLGPPSCCWLWLAWRAVNHGQFGHGCRPGTRPESRDVGADLYFTGLQPLVGFTARTRTAARALSGQELAHRRAPG
jgi:hypothetical protein